MRALQQAAKEFVNTVQLFATRPFNVGETVDVGMGHGQGEVVAAQGQTVTCGQPVLSSSQLVS